MTVAQPEGFSMKAVVQGGDIAEPLRDRDTLGRVAAGNVVDHSTGVTIVEAGTMFDEKLVDLIDNSDCG